MKDFLKLSCTDENKIMVLNLDIYEIIEIFVNGKKCSIRVRKKMLLGYEYFTIENISYSGDIKEYVEHENR
ncbi:hypothetical protein [uncultured Anaerococcus sp.]|uniref:hypothetical protein n=2 Tax=Anaerococcus TaxID=165779 RepID=UPI002803A8B2|nr:hypothetical protein [uncultured Anaerococcus sp.]